MSAVETMEPKVEYEAMLTIENATDLWLGDCTRRGLATRTTDRYRDTLYKFCDSLPRTTGVREVKEEDCARFLDRWNHRSGGTRAAHYAALNGLFKWLYRTRRIVKNPMEFIDPPLRAREGDVEVTTITDADVRKLLDAAKGDRERLTIYILANLGPRRHAVSELRIRDYDYGTKRLLFREKGGKRIPKPCPPELVDVIEASLLEREDAQPDDYLIPSLRTTENGTRDDRVIWRLVKEVANRAGVTTDVHALRRAFAVRFLDQYSDLDALQTLMGHRQAQTTRAYLRSRDRDAAMEIVRGLSWEATAK